MSTYKILVVEDDNDINELLCDHLTLKNFQVSSTTAGFEAKSLIEKEHFDLYIFDWMLPELNGIELCKIVRSNNKTNKKPIIILTAKSDSDSIVQGLDSGANDYIKKPFNLAELTARVNANLRHVSKENILKYKNLSIDHNQRLVLICDEKIKLTNSEFILLTCLIENKNKVLDRDFLIKNLQGDSTVVTSRTVDTHMTGLRKKIKDYSKNIVSIRGIGYKFEI